MAVLWNTVYTRVRPKVYWMFNWLRVKWNWSLFYAHLALLRVVRNIVKH